LFDWHSPHQAILLYDRNCEKSFNYFQLRRVYDHRHMSKNGSISRSIPLSTIILLTLASGGAAANLNVVTLRTEYRENPLGLDVREPRFSRLSESGQRDEEQTAYEIRVASAVPTRIRGRL